MTNLQEPSENSQDQTSWPALVITRGKSQFPIRPIEKQRFLIGAGNICDMQLGDVEIPLLHTILLFQDGSLTCESVVSEPKLLLNGKFIRQATLVNGDTLQLGKYTFQVMLPKKSVCLELTRQFKVDLQREIGPHELQEQENSLWNMPTDVRQAQLEEMSAAELIDLMEGELTQIEEMEDIRLAGLDAMISEALELHAHDSGMKMDGAMSEPATLSMQGALKKEQQQQQDILELVASITSITEKYASCEETIPQDVREELMEAQEQLQLMIYMMDKKKRSA